MTREVFDTLIILVIILGLPLAIARLYRDLTRPLPRQHPFDPRYGVYDDEDTRPHQPLDSHSESMDESIDQSIDQSPDESSDRRQSP
ncbi:MAG: hypothetical protein K8I82_26690 [Anaerolineae bacterium]|nr:hypothetical protein [Anaerolineae bacterium]